MGEETSDRRMVGNNMKKGHVLLLPFTAQGHINPLLQFGKRLASKGLKITFATTVYFSKSMHLKDCEFDVELFSDGFDETGPFGAASGAVFLSTITEVGSRTLSDVINNYNSNPDHEPINCLVCDSILPWALDVGKKFGLITASFYTQPIAVSSIFYHVGKGNLTAPVEESTTTVTLPGLPQLAFQDLPSTVTVLDQDRTSLDMMLGQFSNASQADWLLFNSFDQLESKVLKVMAEVERVRTIGPAVPSIYLDKRIQSDKEHSLNMFTPSDVDYIEWLNSKGAGSVLYASFGSIARLGEEQMEELITGIKQSNKHFLWVIREKEQSKLPDGFAEQVRDKGLLLPWCSQLEVLAHEAVGCFLTHCGWNSTIEALSMGVPMVAMPHIWDQFTNAKFIEDVWELGVRVKKDEMGIVRGKELESCIREVMDGERGETIKANAARWRESAREAVDAGGSSELNIDEFVQSLNMELASRESVH